MTNNPKCRRKRALKMNEWMDENWVDKHDTQTGIKMA